VSSLYLLPIETNQHDRWHYGNSIKQIGEVLLHWLFVHDFVVLVVVVMVVMVVVIWVFGKSHSYFKVVRPCFRVVPRSSWVQNDDDDDPSSYVCGCTGMCL
jgi:hypothetical protein